MFIEMASYVGDVLSLYTDAQVQETFLQYAQQNENLYALAYTLGYAPVISNPSSVDLDIFQQIPAKADGTPDYDYALRIRKNSKFKPNNNSGVEFLTQEDVNFAFSSSFDPTEQTVYSVNGTQPDYFLLKKKVKAISAEVKTKRFNIGSPQRFKTLILEDAKIIGIESIIDSNGNEYTEVPYLAQETVFDEVPNIEANDPELKQYNNQVPFLLRTKKVSKRFVTRFKSNKKLEIQFGAGSTGGDDTTIIPNPDNVGLGIRDGKSLLDKAYDPSNFLYTKAYGEVPSNTTLTVQYLVGVGRNANVNANVINRVGDIIAVPTKGTLDPTVYNTAVASIACNNVQPAIGGGPGDSPQDIKLNASAHFNAQNRAVTRQDYITRVYSFQQKYGNVAKAFIVQDEQLEEEGQLEVINGEVKRIKSIDVIPNPLALNMYLLGYTSDKKLTQLNQGVKQNIKTYLSQYRVLTDAINIKDAYIINIGVRFSITVKRGFNKNEVLFNSIQAVKKHFETKKWQINQPIVLSDIAYVIGLVDGVVTVVPPRDDNPNKNLIVIENKHKVSGGYSGNVYDLDAATRDGIVYPSLDPSIFELKYPNIDIEGRVVGDR